MPANACEVPGSAGGALGCFCRVWIGLHPLCGDRQCALFGSCVSRYQVYSANKTALNYRRSVKFFWPGACGPNAEAQVLSNCHREVCGGQREKQMGHGDKQDAHHAGGSQTQKTLSTMI